MAQEEPTNYQFAGTGLGLQYIEDFAYATSGTVSCPFNTETPLLEFTTGSGLIVGKFDFGMNDVAMDQATQIYYEVYFNDLVVMLRRDEFYGGIGVKSSTMLSTTLHLIIPPQTLVKITVTQNDGNAHDAYGMLSGRVYGTD